MSFVLTVLQWSARNVANKTVTLDELIRKHHPDVILLSETWVREEVFDSYDFNTFRTDQVGVDGGVSVAVKRNNTDIRWKCHVVSSRSEPDFQCIVVNVNIPLWSSINFASVYIPEVKSSGQSELNYGIEQLRGMVKGNRDVFIGGDFSAHHETWSSHFDSRNALLKMFESNNLRVLNPKRTTRTSENPCTDLTAVTKKYIDPIRIKTRWSMVETADSIYNRPIVTKIKLPNYYEMLLWALELEENRL